MFGAIASQNNLEPSALAVWHKSLDLSGNKPSYENLRRISDLAYSVGGFGNFYDFRMYITDASGTGLVPFDSIHWNNVNATLVEVNSGGTVSKTVKKGYSTTSNSGALISNTLIDTSVSQNRTDLACLWIWLDITNSGYRGSGISIVTESRGLFSYVKGDATTGGAGYAGRTAYYAQGDDAFGISGFEVIGSTIKFYKNNIEVSSQSTNWGSFSDFNSNMIDLTLNISATPAPISVGTNKVNAPVKIGGCIIYRPSIVNRTDLYNALNTYITAVLAL